MAVRQLARQELANLDLRFSACHLLISVLPPLVANRTRTGLLRLGGITIGHGTAVGGMFSVHGGRRPASRIRIGEDCWINDSCVLDASAEITIGDRVAMGQGVMILTNTHELGPSAARAGAVIGLPVVVGDGVWLGARSTVLPGSTIGAGAVVAAGAVVNRAVEANTLVAGVPARVVRELDPE